MLLAQSVEAPDYATWAGIFVGVLTVLATVLVGLRQLGVERARDRREAVLQQRAAVSVRYIRTRSGGHALEVINVGPAPAEDIRVWWEDTPVHELGTFLFDAESIPRLAAGQPAIINFVEYAIRRPGVPHEVRFDWTDGLGRHSDSTFVTA